jgi:serine/threonine-protein kinase PknG
LVTVAPVPYRDPSSAIMAEPKVAEQHRFCGNCEKPVGRANGGLPGRVEGFCRHCGTAYSFEPKLVAGDVVAGQYDVLGCLAHGGLGWIYLARDRNVNDRWVVLKGLLDIGDADAMASAAAERQFLASVEHPNIVKIYNFVQHPDLKSKPVGYIVMEYVGGNSLKELRSRTAADGRLEPLPLAQGLAYILEILPALGYLHEQGLLYCDFKPDNVIQSEEQLKLIDLGAVRRHDDQDSAGYKTDGYCAPELESDGASVESDLFTVGRTLAVLTFNFDFRHRFRYTLPEATEVPLLAANPSFHRLITRATAADPNVRFGSAGEMAEQVTGVLREVAAAQDGVPKPAPSSVLGTERAVFGAELDIWPAAFGAARTRLALRDIAGAVAVAESVPASSNFHLAAQLVAIRSRVAGGADERYLVEAGAILAALDLDAEQLALTSIHVLDAAWHMVSQSPAMFNGSTVLGCTLDERSVRGGLERQYRTLARLARDKAERRALINRANAIRPVTWV